MGEARLARELAVARRTNGFVTAHALEKLDNVVNAYRLQEGVRAELGAKVVGWKLAAPPSAEVISAPLFDIECMASGTVLANAALLRDGVECELALRIDRPLPFGGCTRDDVITAVGAVMPAFELLCSRLPAKFASPREHIVADGMGQGAVVLGAPCGDWRTLDLDKLRVTLWSGDALVVDVRAVRARQVSHVERVVPGGQLAMQAGHEGGVHDEVGAGRAADGLDVARHNPERHGVHALGHLRTLKNPHAFRPAYRTANVLFSQFASALVTAGLTVRSASEPYSSTSPVVAGTSRWLMPGTRATWTGGAFLRARARPARRSAFDGATCVSSSPCRIRIGCFTSGMTFDGSLVRML